MGGAKVDDAAPESGESPVGCRDDRRAVNGREAARVGKESQESAGVTSETEKAREVAKAQSLMWARD